jgi:hypothetical protein
MGTSLLKGEEPFAAPRPGIHNPMSVLPVLETPSSLAEHRRVLKGYSIMDGGG